MNKKIYSFKHMERSIESKLEWLFNQADADIGISSNWNIVESQATVGQSVTRDYYTDRRMEAIHTRREMEKVYFSLSTTHQDILFAKFGWKTLNTFSPHLRNIFGEYLPIVAHQHPNMSNKVQPLHRIQYLEQARLVYREAIIAYFQQEMRKPDV